VTTESTAPKKTQERHLLAVPVLPLRDVVAFPHIAISLFVGRDRSVRALDQAMEGEHKILLIAQKSADIENPTADDLYPVGTLATVMQLLKLPDGTVKVLVEGEQRAEIVRFTESDTGFMADVRLLDDTALPKPREQEGWLRSLSNELEQYVKLNRKLSSEVLASLSSIEHPGQLADAIASHMPLKLEEKQKILQIRNVTERIERVLGALSAETDMLRIEKRIRGRVKGQMEKNQREYYLNEKIRAIQKELGDLEEANEMEELKKRIDQAGMPKEAKEKAETELSKLKMMSPMAAEATVVRNYLDWMTTMPWKKRTKIRHDLAAAEAVLEADHYGLDKVKERILEYLAVQQRVSTLKGPILCLVGPPGVGKTSLGQSIARATNRKFIRMSLGGVRDEAEIRGHRRTYIGSMPGKILQNLSKAKTRNPLFLLDEMDKMGMDFRGDPAAALLEVLDPEQNHTFVDHYLEVEFDLSEVMFVATANSLNIPPALLDRMEVIRLSGYTEDEKVNIAQKYLMAKQMQNHGVKPEDLALGDSALRNLVRYYTREAGVRNLDRELAKICRKVVREQITSEKASEPHKSREVTSRSLERYLGVKRFRFGRSESTDRIGQVTGLAWTEVGGELLSIEAAVLPGKGKLIQTGKLGEVMQESIQAAVTVVRSRAKQLGIDPEFQSKRDLHIHVPEGATPKDGPSAGVGMCTALVSALTDIPVRADVAMTGEITLRGELLPIGGLKEKLLAAHRGGISVVIIPTENERDLVEIPKNVKQNLDIRPVRWIDEVWRIALQYQPDALLEAPEIPLVVTPPVASADESAGLSH
jgi:ATP-dependent Lon protease